MEVFKKIFGKNKLVMLLFLLIAMGMPFWMLSLTTAVEADAADYPIMSIPAISLNAKVKPVEIENHELATPDKIAGSYERENKVFIFGHSTTVFVKLKDVEIGDKVEYKEKIYTVESVELVEKGEIDMKKLLNTEQEPTLIMMTCAGELLDGGDATHRIIITARGPLTF